jgi:hypothetical protein
MKFGARRPRRSRKSGEENFRRFAITRFHRYRILSDFRAAPLAPPPMCHRAT